MVYFCRNEFYEKILIIIACSFSIYGYGQPYAEVVNNEFNEWDSDTNPSAWSTLEDAVGAGNGIVQKDQADIRNGAASLRLVTPQPSATVNYSMVALGNLMYDNTIHRLVSSGAAYRSKPDSVWILYKYNSPASDSAGIAITLAANNGGAPQNILNVLYPIPESTEWKLASYKLHTRYTSAATPDSIYVSLFSSASRERTPNSVLQIDGIYFNNPSTTTSVAEISGNPFLKLYPNPLASGSVLNVASADDMEGARLHLIDVAGREAGSYRINRRNTVSVNRLPSGHYFWFITDPHDNILGKGKLAVQ